MKFKMISENDIKVIREARKVLKKLKKQQNKLDAKETMAIEDITCDYMPYALKNWRMLDELEALHISVEDNGNMSLDAQ